MPKMVIIALMRSRAPRGGRDRSQVIMHVPSDGSRTCRVPTTVEVELSQWKSVPPGEFHFHYSGIYSHVDQLSEHSETTR